MAKTQILESRNAQVITAKRKTENTAGLTAATFSTNGKKGKPARPSGMSDAEWFKVIANMRIEKVLKAMQGMVRLATLEGGEFTEKQAQRIISAMQERMNLVESTFAEVLANPNKKVTAKVVRQRFFQ